MIKKYKKIGIWGQYGDGGIIADGQAVRTTITTQELIKRYGEDEVCILNTNAWKKHPIKFFFDTVNLLRKCENVIILPADNGLKVVVPIYNLFNYIYKRKLFYIVIGGFLPSFLKENSSYVKMLNKYEVLYVQTTHLKEDLSKQGIKHIELMTNFKLQHTRDVQNIHLISEENVKVCILSRLTKDKGVEDAIEAVKIANNKLGGNKIHLDLYGIVPENYKEVFDEIVSNNSEIVSYKGVVNYNQTALVLKDYFALLFPTYFHGEGFAGCLIDAFFAGIPVIATDWLYNKDVIVEGENGLLVEPQSPLDLANAILTLYYDRLLSRKISINNANEAKKYCADEVLKCLYDRIL